MTKKTERKFVCVNITMPPDIWIWVKEKPNISGLIAALLEREMELEQEIVYCKAGHPIMRSSLRILRKCPECERLHKETEKNGQPTEESKARELKLLEDQEKREQERKERGVEQ